MSLLLLLRPSLGVGTSEEIPPADVLVDGALVTELDAPPAPGGRAQEDIADESSIYPPVYATREPIPCGAVHASGVAVASMERVPAATCSVVGVDLFDEYTGVPVSTERDRRRAREDDDEAMFVLLAAYHAED